MGKIFGISDNTVSTIDKVFKSVEIPKPKVTSLKVQKHNNEKEKFFAKFPHSPRPLSDFWGRRVRKGGKSVEMGRGF